MSKQGDNVSKIDAIRHAFYANLTGFSRSYPIQLLQCDEATPPSRKTNAVKHYVELNCSVQSSDLREWTTATSKRMQRLHFDLEMLPSGASMDFRVHCNGRIAGEKDVTVSFTQEKGSPGKGNVQSCHYNAACTNPDCAFKHTVGRCTRDMSCSNAKCRYRHTKKPCHFGFRCKNKDDSCKFRHPSPGPKDSNHSGDRQKRPEAKKAKGNGKSKGEDA